MAGISSLTKAEEKEVLRRWMCQLHFEDLEALVDYDTAVSLRQMTQHMGDEDEREIGSLCFETHEDFAESFLPRLDKTTRRRLAAAGLWLYLCACDDVTAQSRSAQP